jgi:hypothetical protein
MSPVSAQAQENPTHFPDSDYSQLGLGYRLELAEVLFNRGLCLVYLGDREGGVQAMEEASKHKVSPEHNVIEEAIQDGAEGYTVFSIVSVPAPRHTPNASD